MTPHSSGLGSLLALTLLAVTFAGGVYLGAVVTLRTLSPHAVASARVQAP